jgi:hypothetical protein
VPSTADASDSGVDDALGPDAWRGGLASADGLELLLVVTGGPGNMDADPCAIDYEPSVEESAAQVRVIVEGRRSAKYDPSTTVCPDTQVERQIVVELVEPLSSRQVVALGQPRTLVDGAALSVFGGLPTGWALLSQRPPLIEQASATDWSRTWGGAEEATETGQCVPGSAPVTLIEGLADLLDRFPFDPGEAQLAEVEIGGEKGVASAEALPALVRVRWVSAGRGYVLESRAICNGDHVPTVDELVQMAQTIG